MTGRRSLLTDDLVDKLARYLRNGATIKDACSTVGIVPRTYDSWHQRGEIERDRLRALGHEPRLTEATPNAGHASRSLVLADPNDPDEGEPHEPAESDVALLTDLRPLETPHLRFMLAVDEARAAGRVLSLSTIRSAAMGGFVIERRTITRTARDGAQTVETIEKIQPPQWTAAAWLLERTDPKTWGRRVIHVTQDDLEDRSGDVPAGATADDVRLAEQISIYRQGVADGEQRAIERGVIDVEAAERNVPPDPVDRELR